MQEHCGDGEVGGAYLVRKDGASEKKWQELLVLLTMGYEGAVRGDYGLAERWGKINPQFEFDLSGGRAIEAEGQWWGVINTRSLCQR